MSRRAIWVTLTLLLALACVIGGLIAGNSNEASSRHRGGSSVASKVAEEEFREGWDHAAEEERREREESPTGESKWEELAH